MDASTLEALNRASSLELFHLSTVIERLMSDPVRIVQIRLHLNLGQHVRFVDVKAPGAALQLRSGTVVAMKDTQVTRVRQLRSQVLVFARAHFQKCHYNSANCSGAAGFSIPKA